MNHILAMESLTIAQIKLIIDREEIRKAKIRDNYKRWVEKKKQSGEFADLKRAYNLTYNKKKKKAAVPAEDVECPE